MSAFVQPDRRFRGDAYRYITDEDGLPTQPELRGIDPVCRVKLFLAGSRWTYYVAALTLYDEEPVVTGWCVSPLGADCDEWGDASLREIMEIRSPRLGLPVERDLTFEPTRLSAIRDHVASKGRAL